MIRLKGRDRRKEGAPDEAFCNSTPLTWVSRAPTFFCGLPNSNFHSQAQHSASPPPTSPGSLSSWPGMSTRCCHSYFLRMLIPLWTLVGSQWVHLSFSCPTYGCWASLGEHSHLACECQAGSRAVTTSPGSEQLHFMGFGDRMEGRSLVAPAFFPAEPGGTCSQSLGMNLFRLRVLPCILQGLCKHYPHWDLPFSNEGTDNASSYCLCPGRQLHCPFLVGHYPRFFFFKGLKFTPKCYSLPQEDRLRTSLPWSSFFSL